MAFGLGLFGKSIFSTSHRRWCWEVNLHLPEKDVTVEVRSLKRPELDETDNQWQFALCVHDPEHRFSDLEALYRYLNLVFSSDETEFLHEIDLRLLDSSRTQLEHWVLKRVKLISIDFGELGGDYLELNFHFRSQSVVLLPPPQAKS